MYQRLYEVQVGRTRDCQFKITRSPMAALATEKRDILKKAAAYFARLPE